jgi:hypothetical protein
MPRAAEDRLTEPAVARATPAPAPQFRDRRHPITIDLRRWIVDVPERRAEAYGQPTGSTARPACTAEPLV